VILPFSTVAISRQRPPQLCAGHPTRIFCAGDELVSMYSVYWSRSGKESDGSNLFLYRFIIESNPKVGIVSTQPGNDLFGR
jgi:hypothetical protein